MQPRNDLETLKFHQPNKKIILDWNFLGNQKKKSYNFYTKSFRKQHPRWYFTPTSIPYLKAKQKPESISVNYSEIRAFYIQNKFFKGFYIKIKFFLIRDFFYKRPNLKILRVENFTICFKNKDLKCRSPAHGFHTESFRKLFKLFLSRLTKLILLLQCFEKIFHLLSN